LGSQAPSYQGLLDGFSQEALKAAIKHTFLFLNNDWGLLRNHNILPSILFVHVPK
jgi:hypothetical protein